MIRMIFIAPYLNLQPVVEQVLKEYVSTEQIAATVLAKTDEQLYGASLNCDVVIARGFSLEVLKNQHPEMLHVPLQVSGYDIIRAVHTAIQQYHPRKIAVIGSRSMVASAENLNGIFAAEIHAYEIASSAQLEQTLQLAQSEGCSCFIGGLSLIEKCRGYYSCVLVETGQASILNSLEEAVRLVTSTRTQLDRSTRYQTILDHLKNGVISVDESHKIISINSTAQDYFSLYDGGYLGLPIRQFLPFAEGPIRRVFSTGLKIENEMCEFSGQLFAVDYIPITTQKEVTGVMTFIRSVNRLQQEESLIRKKLPGHIQHAKYRFEDILCRSKVFADAVETARIYAKADSPVLIVGESGTGKELMAQSIHNASSRKDGPFIAINCAALSESLLESELFGYSDGAFTGALKGGKEGLFEAAHGGTLFLDEISEIPISFQSKLLRVLQEGEVRRIGVSKVISIDVRVIAATNQNLLEQVRRGLFRRDLLFRLDVLNLYIPPLRRRPEDVIDLFELYVQEYARRYHKAIALITSDAKKLLRRHPWEGNVRELKNIAERICVLNRENIIGAELVHMVLQQELMQELSGPLGVVDFQPEEDDELMQAANEQELILLLLQKYEGNKSKVARHMGIDRSTLWRKLKRYGILIE